MRKSRSAFLLTLLMLALPAFLAAEQEKKTSAQLIAYDQLVQPGKKIFIKGRLLSQGLMFRDRPISGERVEFLLDGKYLSLTFFQLE